MTLAVLGVVANRVAYFSIFNGNIRFAGVNLLLWQCSLCRNQRDGNLSLIIYGTERLVVKFARRYSSRLVWAVSLGLWMCSCAHSLSAAPPLLGNPTPQVLDSGDPIGGQGWAVDISGNLAVVGTPFFEGGAAFIFDLTTGELLHRLHPGDPLEAGGELFGFSVAIDDGLAIVASGQRNAAYIFDATTGEQRHKLSPTASDYVRSVDISNGIAVLGAPSVRFDGNDYGAAFLYDAVTGIQTNRINGPTTSLKRDFGRVVAVDGDAVAIVSPGINKDDVYVFDSQTGAYQWKYGASTAGNNFFASDVVIEGDRVVIGGQSLSVGPPRAYVLNRSTGALERSFITQTQETIGGDKYEIDVSGDQLVVGAFEYSGENGSGFRIGDVHSFDVATGDFLGTVNNPVPQSGSSFGFAVALDKGRLVVGAPGVGPSRGLTYSFLIPEPTMTTLAAIALIPIAYRRRRQQQRHSLRRSSNSSPAERSFASTFPLACVRV